MFENIEIQELDNRMGNRYIVATPISHFIANEMTAKLIICLKTSVNTEQATDAFVLLYPQYSHHQIQGIIESSIIPTLTGKPQTHHQFIYQHCIFTPSFINRITKRIQFLFSPLVFTIISIVGVTSLCSYFLFAEDILNFTSHIGVYEFFTLVIVLLLSSFLHELGHASAANYFGIKTGEIGIGLYLNFPVFYTDVSNIWRLEIKKRCIVNVAGVYFQTILTSVFVALFALTSGELFKYVILAITFGFLLTLNPFF